MRQFLINATVVLVSLLVLAAVGEGVVRWLQHNDYLVDYRKPNKKQKSQPQRVYAPKFRPSPNPKLFVEFDPADPQVNALGMRGPLPSKQKSPGVFRIAVLGDSVAFGYGLKDEDSFPRMLETSLRQQGFKVEMINFAVCGYGLEAYPEVYLSKARDFKPDLVLLGYVLNDPAPTSVVFDAIGAQMKQKARLKRIAKYSQLLAWLMDTYNKAADSRANTRLFNEGYFQPENQQQIGARLAELQAVTSADQVPLVTFIFPYFHDMQDYPMEKVHMVLRQLLKQNGMAHHDLLEEYRSHDGIALRLEDGDYTHPNAEGQRIAAEAIERYLKKEKML